jgi:hypothetical protein
MLDAQQQPVARHSIEQHSKLPYHAAAVPTNCCLQVQDAVMSCQLPTAPHIVAPIREHGSSSMALKYLQDLSQRLGGGAASVPAAGAAAKLRAWFGKRRRRRTKSSTSSRSSSSDGNGASCGSSAAVVKPEFLVFRDVTSAVLAQVGFNEPDFNI